MAEEDDSQKTEDPTAQKLDEAFKKGNVPKSQEVNTFLILLGGLLALTIFAEPLGRSIIEEFTPYIGQGYDIPIDPAGLETAFYNLQADVGAKLAMFVAFVMVFGLIANLIQHKPMITFEKIKPELNKISPVKGLKRMFSMQSLVDLLKGIIKIVLVGVITFSIIWPDRELLPETVYWEPIDLLRETANYINILLGATIGFMFVIAGADYAYQKYEHTKNLRMSKQEIKDEMKNSEGDPEIKAKLRQLRMEKTMQRMMTAIPKSDVVVTNPTHYAVALQYDSQGERAAPVVLAKGQDYTALRIRKIATEHDIPIYEDPPVARTLFASVEVDEEIKPEHYKAVAQVISFVMQLKADPKKRRAYQREQKAREEALHMGDTPGVDQNTRRPGQDI